MDDVWNTLQAMTVRANADRSPREADRANAKKLNEGRVGDDWKTFYEGIEALERGCGYTDYGELVELCKTASLQDDGRLLQVIEQKTKLFEMVLFLRSVEPPIKMAWINDGSVTNTDALFECIRQALADMTQNGPELDIIVKGLCNLQQKSSEHFQYLLKRNILYKGNMVSVASRLMEYLPKNGWSALAQCISFNDVIPDQMRFWDQCASGLAWDTVYLQAEPLLEAWKTYITQGFGGHYRQSLYCDVSNMLIAILVYKLGTVEQYLDVLERAVHAGEIAMYRWYERETQQFGPLIACLSVIEHLRYVWISNSAAYAKPFPKELCSRCLTLISQWRHLWIPCGKDRAGNEILQLENWLKRVSTV